MKRWLGRRALSHVPGDALLDAVVVVDGHRRITEVNDRMCELVGLRREDLVGTRPPYPYWPAEERERLRAAARTIVERGRGEFDLTLRHRDGRPLRVHAQSTRLPRGRGYVTLLRDVTEQHRSAALERALGEIATAVAAAARPDEVLGLVARHATSVLGTAGAAVLRLEPGRDAAVVAGQHGTGLDPATPIELGDAAVLERWLGSGRAARVDDVAALPAPGAQALADRGLRCAVAIPVRAGERVWGAIAVVDREPAALPAVAEAHLRRFADLLGLAVANADARARLETQAATDSLTGLTRHGVFQERLRAEAARARRHGRALAVALFDIDGFRQINEEHGHQVGDRAVQLVAGVLRGSLRASEVAGRIGGDEFALLLPETDSAGAVVAAERVRATLAGTPMAARLGLRLSAGTADLAQAGDDAEELLRLADGALYWAKVHGRDRAVRYDPAVVQQLSDAERVERLDRARALAGLRALARAVDAKDPAMRRHSERVAELAVRLARACGWSEEDAARLHDAGLLHDVGKVGVADAVLRKPGRLTQEELELVKPHARLGAEIAAEVLDDEQAAWIHAHHERPDGRGYPDGLAGDALPVGAQLLAVADAFDVMTSEVRGRSPEEALAECRSLAGAQFGAGAVDALEAALAATPPPLSAVG